MSPQAGAAGCLGNEELFFFALLVSLLRLVKDSVSAQGKVLFDFPLLLLRLTE